MLSLAHRLRDEGIRLEYSLVSERVPKQLKLADARSARVAVVLGPDERSRGAVVLRDLKEGSQREVPLASVGAELKRTLEGDGNG